MEDIPQTPKILIIPLNQNASIKNHRYYDARTFFGMIYNLYIETPSPHPP
jgi:hypothetical protein